MLRSLAATLCLAALGCATAATETRSEERETQAYAPASASPADSVLAASLEPKTFDAKGYAATFPRAPQCEQAARALQPRSADTAWAVLKACIGHQDFTVINRLIDGAWDKDLQSRPDASLLLARVIARRGGDVAGDLAMLRQRRIPLFSLQAAIAQPETYQGRLVLIRGRITEQRSQGGTPVVMLTEVGLGAKTTDVEVGPAFTSSHRTSANGTMSASSPEHGSASLEASGRVQSDSRHARTRQHTENVTTETGLEALVRLTKPDPFLENEREFIVLARFDGVRATSREEPQPDDEGPGKLAVVSLVAYFEPAALLLE